MAHSWNSTSWKPTTARRRTLLAMVAAGTLALAACAPVTTVTTVSTMPRSASVTSGQVVDIPSDTQGALEVVLADGRSFRVPPGHFPPPGTCRIWHPNRPPGQQPQPGSCSELLAAVPADAVVLRR